MNFYSWIAIKGQALAEFIVEFTYSNAAEVTGTANSTEAAKEVGVKEREDSVPTEEDVEQWTLYVDGASNDNGSTMWRFSATPNG